MTKSDQLRPALPRRADISSRPTVTFASCAVAAIALLAPTAASATNEEYQFGLNSCRAEILGGCASVGGSTPSATGYSLGGAYAFASGYRGGYTFASAGFAPGAPTLLPSGTYSEGAVSFMTYTFQVQGAPDTLVPLRMIGNVSVSPIRLTDSSGNVATLANGVPGPAPSEQFRVNAFSQVQVGALRGTPFPVRGASTSFEANYFGNASGLNNYCINCGGGGSSFDEVVWVYSNSDIRVSLTSSVLLEYISEGPGGPLTVFGSVSAETDPIFQIDDPAYAGFSIVGVPTGDLPTTVGGVPEPATWAMMIAGFGLSGVALRSRRRRSLYGAA